MLRRILETVFKCIFHQRLHGQSRYLFRHALLIYRVFHEKTVRETDFLYRHEIPHILDLFSDRHEGGRLHGIAHHHGKCLCHIHNLIIIPNQRQHGDALQRIIDKMRVNLALKRLKGSLLAFNFDQILAFNQALHILYHGI